MANGFTLTVPLDDDTLIANIDDAAALDRLIATVRARVAQDAHGRIIARLQTLRHIRDGARPARRLRVVALPGHGQRVEEGVT